MTLCYCMALSGGRRKEPSSGGIVDTEAALSKLVHNAKVALR